MFISKSEKEQIQLAIKSLQARVRDLEIEAMWFKNKPGKTPVPILKTKDAPYGVKKNGEPRKQSGRPRLTMKVGDK